MFGQISWSNYSDSVICINQHTKTRSYDNQKTVKLMQKVPYIM